MRPTVRIIAVLSFAAATTAAAQGPAPQRAGGPPAAQMLLGQTGELELTDAQVVRLAAIARRSEARRRSLRLAMDSARTRFGQPGDSMARRQFGQRMQADMQRTEEQMRIDQRDAIAVLTPDQQAKAWNMVSNRGQRMRGGPGGARGRGMSDRMGGARGMREFRGQEQRPPSAGMREPGFRGERQGQGPRMRRPDGQGTGNS